MNLYLHNIFKEGTNPPSVGKPQKNCYLLMAVPLRNKGKVKTVPFRKTEFAKDFFSDGEVSTAIKHEEGG